MNNNHPPSMELDSRQKELVELFNKIAHGIKPTGIFSKLKSLFYKDTSPNGIYLHGKVGRGKTVLMKNFYEQVSVPKEIIHFQKFMQELHSKAHKLQTKSANRVVQDLAKSIAARSQVICMDEFEIKDITDAMLIMRLFKYLAKHKVFIFLTTNTEPDNLYKDGLQRESFLPFIKMVNKTFEVLHLNTEKDYRFERFASSNQRILFPSSDKTKEAMSRIKNELCEKAELSEGVVEVFGRKIKFKQTHQNTLFTTYSELLLRDLGYADYVTICEKYKIIVLEGMEKISEVEGDIATRFINFIDNAYFYRVLLFVEIKCTPEEIYTKGGRKAEFVRTVSRLNEMNAHDYSLE